MNLGLVPGGNLNSDEDRFHLLMDAVTDYAIYLLDRDGMVMTWNAGAERLKGYTAEEITGRHFRTFFTPAVLEPYPQKNEKLVTT